MKMSEPLDNTDFELDLMEDFDGQLANEIIQEINEFGKAFRGGVGSSPSNAVIGSVAANAATLIVRTFWENAHQRRFVS
jgi:hypothetical protein